MSARLRILQFGGTGQVARELIHAAVGRYDVRVLTRDDVDFRYPDQVARAVATADAVDVVINAVAYTAVDDAENAEALARTINGLSAGALAEACSARNIPIVYLSTDYVFDGLKATPYVEQDNINPINAYGRSKALGEKLVSAAGGRHAIVRTSWVYSVHGTNFVKTMLQLGKKQQKLQVVDDQIGAPTTAASVAQVSLCISDRLARSTLAEDTGTFHYSDAGETTWRHFADIIFACAGMRVCVAPITTAQYPTPAQRPLNSRLDCTKIARVYGVKQPPWQEQIAHVVSSLIGGGKQA